MFYRIWGKAIFPEGIAPGEGKGESNILITARNGQQIPLLRGTAIAGALRDHFRIVCQNDGCPDLVEKWFGAALEKGQEKALESRVIVNDMVLRQSSHRTIDSNIHTHNMINRHTGSVVNSGLFSLEVYPPDTTGDFLLYIKGSDDNDENNEFIHLLKECLGQSIILGGNRNRGIGRLVFDGKLKIGKFDPHIAQQYAQWIDCRYLDRQGTIKNSPLDSELTIENNSNRFSVDLNLAIPAGEDLVIGYGTTWEKLQSAPQDTVKADGKRYWCLPGSSIRGVFRSWMTRLAAMDGYHIYDQATTSPEKLKGSDLGWGIGISDNERDKFKKEPDRLDDPILNLFGSLYKHGRIHFTNAYSTTEAKDSDEQKRCHVAIDRFSGGANNGALFSNKVLKSGIKFKMNISIEEPRKIELAWLLKTIKAINLGIISFGSSKASGLLEISNYQDVEKKIMEKINE